jgi:hypothetical protein
MYTLIRKKDGLKKSSNAIIWIEFNDDGRFKEKYDEPNINRSLLMSPFNDFFTWQTTPITEIIEIEDGKYIRFKTKNSEYELYTES